MRRSVEQIVNKAASEMRSPTRFGELVSSLETELRGIDDEALREFGLSPGRRAEEDWAAVVEKMAEEGNLFLVFDGEESGGAEFVMGDKEDQLRACFVVTDPVPFERPLSSDEEFVVAREGFNTWAVREYRPAVLETIFELGEEPSDEEPSGEEPSDEEAPDDEAD